MNDPATWVDEITARVVLAVPAAEEHGLLHWVAVLRAGVEEVDPNDWPQFETRVGELAATAGFDTAAVAEFLATAAEAGGHTAVTALLDLGDDLPAVFAGLRQSPASQVDDAAGEHLGWLTDPQRSYVAHLWGADWPGCLWADLERRWGADWWQHPDEHKTAWLDELISANEYVADTGGTGDAFGWVSGEQAAVLADLWGSNWRAVLSGELVARWGPDWHTHPAEHKATWLGDLIAAGAFTDDQDDQHDEVDPEAADLLAQITEVTGDIPGIEQLSDEEIARIIGEALEQARS